MKPELWIILAEFPYKEDIVKCVCVPLITCAVRQNWRVGMHIWSVLLFFRTHGSGTWWMNNIYWDECWWGRALGQPIAASSGLLSPFQLRAAFLASNRGHDDWNQDNKGRGCRADTPQRRGQVSRRTKFTHTGSLTPEECSAVKRSHRAASGTKRA